MELCTTPISISSSSYHILFFSSKPTDFRFKTSFPLTKTSPSRINPGVRYLTSPLLKATTSEETSSGPNQFFTEGRDGVTTLEDVPLVEKNVHSETVSTEVPKEESPMDEQTQAFEFLDKINMKFDSEDSYSVLLYGSGALLALWFASAIVGAIDSIPVFPKLMEVVGLGYTFWFSTRYLLFKNNRDELFAKIEEVKQQVMGSNDD